MKHLVLSGGAFSQKELIDKALLLVGGNDKAKIGFITITSSDDEGAKENGLFHTNRSTHWGIRSDWINVTHQNKNSRELVELLNECNVYYFTGGVQFRTRISRLQNEKEDRWQDSLALRTIRNRVNTNKAIIIGFSAGTMIMQGRGMICNGESYQAFTTPILNANDMKQEIERDIDNYFNDQMILDYDGGYNFFTHGVLDTHFSQRGREGRIIRTMLETNRRLGFGIDEGTALFTKETNNESIFECYGFNSVAIFQLKGSNLINQKPFHIKDVSYSLMQNGDLYYGTIGRFNFKGKKPFIPSKKTGQLVVHDAFTSPNNRDVYGGRDEKSELRDLALQLIQSSDQVIAKAFSYESPRIYVQLMKTGKTRAYIGKDGKISFENMSISIMEQTK